MSCRKSSKKWLTQMTLLENIGNDYKLSIPFKLAALRILMTNKVDKFDQIKEQAKNSVPSDTKEEEKQEEVFNQTVLKLREYITDKRLEANFHKKNADDMDIGFIGEKDDEDQGEGDQEYDHSEDFEDYCDSYYSDVNAFGKGGKGWGKQAY